MSLALPHRRAALAAVVGGFRPAAQAVLNAMAAAGAPVSSARASLIDAAIGTMEASGAWALIDRFHMLAAHSAAAARIDWKTATTTLTPTNSPTFTADQGYAGDGVSAHLDTGFNPATAGGGFSRDSSHAGIVIQDGQAVGTDAVFGNEDNIISPWRTGPQMLIRSSSTGSTAINLSGAQTAHKGFSRTGSAGYTPYEAGAALSPVTEASAALASRNFLLLGRNSSGGILTPSARRLFAAHWGAGLTAAQMLSIRNAIAAYRAALGT